jgi:hypothetical protein
VLLLVVSCSTKPTVQRLPDLSFADSKPIYLDVGQLEIISQYQPPGKAPNYEHLMPISPEAAAIRWAKDRLRPVGRTGFARVVIKDAAVIKTDLKTDKSIKGMLKDEQAERYDGTLEVMVEILDARHMSIGTDVTSRATRTRSLAEDVTVNERERALYEITESMARDIDTQLDGLIRSYMGKWLVQQ